MRQSAIADVKISPEFWTSGWLSALSTPAVSMYVVLLCAQTSDEVSEVGSVPTKRQAVLLSADTRSRDSPNSAKPAS